MRKLNAKLTPLVSGDDIAVGSAGNDVLTGGGGRDFMAEAANDAEGRMVA